MASISDILVCPNCRSHLVWGEHNLRCDNCNHTYSPNQYGYWVLTEDTSISEIASTTHGYAKEQESNGIRVYHDYLKPLLHQEPFERVLDVGCGIGKGVSLLVEDGYEAFGIDLPSLSKFWNDAGNSPHHFFCADTRRLPFKDESFDVVYSLGVIENIGTETGHCTLSKSYWQDRQQYANEILRVTKPGGRIIIACPNKSFPIDIHHGPRDELSPPYPLRTYLFEKTGLNLHPTWGGFHLCSYAEVKHLFCDVGGARNFQPLPLAGYFGFKKLDRPLLKPLMIILDMYINRLPKSLRQTCLNPYLLVQIRR